MTKQLRKALMKRSRSSNDFPKDRNDASQSAYRKQSNLCVTLLQKLKKNSITDNKYFGNQLNPYSLIK